MRIIKLSMIKFCIVLALWSTPKDSIKYYDSIVRLSEYQREGFVSDRLSEKVFRIFMEDRMDKSRLIFFSYFIYMKYHNVKNSQQLINLYDSLDRLVGSDLRKYSAGLGYLSQLMNLKGLSHYDIGRYNDALNCYYRGLRYLDEAMKNAGLEEKISYMEKMVAIYNNIGLLYYQIVHPSDGLDKRLEFGKLIEEVLVKADSINDNLEKMLGNSSKICKLNYSSHLINLNLLYGSYYSNDLKYYLYDKKLVEKIMRCRDTVALIKYKVMKAFNHFYNQRYSDAIKLMREVERNVRFVSSIRTFDVNYLLMSSYHHLKKMDSSCYYANKVILDTLRFRDYVILSDAASLLSDCYLTTDIKKSRDYLAYSKMFIQKAEHDDVRDDIENNGKKKQINEITLRNYEINKRMIQMEEDSIRNLIRWMVVINSILVLTMFVVLRSFKRHLKKKIIYFKGDNK